MTYEEKVTLLRIFADRVENECYVAKYYDEWSY